MDDDYECGTSMVILHKLFWPSVRIKKIIVSDSDKKTHPHLAYIVGLSLRFTTVGLAQLKYLLLA